MTGTKQDLSQFQSEATFQGRAPTRSPGAYDDADSPTHRVKDLASLARAMGGVVINIVHVTLDALRGGYEQ
jgi:hypothetical protein